jgi:hypothetical protein
MLHLILISWNTPLIDPKWYFKGSCSLY